MSAQQIATRLHISAGKLNPSEWARIQEQFSNWQQNLETIIATPELWGPDDESWGLCGAIRGYNKLAPEAAGPFLAKQIEQIPAWHWDGSHVYEIIGRAGRPFLDAAADLFDASQESELRNRLAQAMAFNRRARTRRVLKLLLSPLDMSHGNQLDLLIEYAGDLTVDQIERALLSMLQRRSSWSAEDTRRAELMRALLEAHGVYVEMQLGTAPQGAELAPQISG